MSAAQKGWLGKTLVYADGRRSKIVNVGKIKGQPAMLLEPIGEKALTSQDTLRRISEVELWLELGIWKIE